MENNNVWMLRSAWLSKQSSVNKLLREGFEPFWGYRVTVNGKPDTRMYFRKPPILEEIKTVEEAFELPAIKTEPVTFDLTPLIEFSNEFRSLLSGVLEQFTERFFERLSASQTSAYMDQGEITRGDRSVHEGDFPGTSAHPEHIELDEGESGEHDAPAGDSFRPLAEQEEAPVITTTKNRTPQQDRTIESLKKEHGNISILPGGEGGAIRVMAGSDIYTVGISGNFTVEETGANTSSLGL